jgi:hypothetical protein
MPDVTVMIVRQERDAGRDGHDRPGSLLQQMRGERVDGADRAEDVDRDRGLGVGDVRGVPQILYEHHAGHGHHDVELGMCGEHLVAGGSDRVWAGDVYRHRLEVLDQVRVAAADDDGVARGLEPARETQPDAGGASDDQHSAIGQLHDVTPSVESLVV